MELLKNNNINKYNINIIEGKNPFYSSNYSLALVELKILKVYIETYSKTAYI